jgi:hypothetical protein
MSIKPGEVQTMSWTAFHSRGETLRAVVDTANTRQDGILPMQVPGVDENFTDETDLVGALLLKWHARLSGNIERALTREPVNPEAAVASAWRTTAEQMPGVRLVIDRCAEAPANRDMAEAMTRAQQAEWVRLAQAAGLANGRDHRAVAAGRRVEKRARAAMTTDLASTPEPTESPDTIESKELIMKHRAGNTTKSTTATTNETDETRAGQTPAEGRSTESFVERIKAVLAA